MSRRKPPVTTKAQREAMPENFSDLREKMKECMAKIEQATRPTIQPTKPPASDWRSMASAPRDGKWISAKCECDAFVAIRWEERRLLWVSRMGTVFFDFELAAWAPIPEWTGEVSE